MSLPNARSHLRRTTLINVSHLHFVVVREAHQHGAQLLHGCGKSLLNRFLLTLTDAADARE